MSPIKRILLGILVLLLLVPCGLLLLPGVRAWLGSMNHALEYLEIILAYLSVLASIGIAVLIYYFEKKNIDKERTEHIRSAKLLMYNELDKAIRLYVFRSDQYVNSSLAHLKDVFREHSLELHDGLTEEQYSHLNMIVDCIDSFIVSVEEYGRSEASGYILLIFREWLRLFFKSEYYEFFSKARDYKELLDKRTFDLLCALSGSRERYQANLREIKDDDDRALFNYYSDKRICVFDHGIILFDGWYEWDDIQEELKVNGFQKTHEYVGFFKDGVRSGQGIEYNHHGKVLAQGVWRDGDLISGTEYDWVIKIENGQEECFFRFYEDYFRRLDGEDRFTEMLEECKSFDGCYLADIVIKGEYMDFMNLRPFGEFIKTLPPEEDDYSMFIEE